MQYIFVKKNLEFKYFLQEINEVEESINEKYLELGLLVSSNLSWKNEI